MTDVHIVRPPFCLTPLRHRVRFHLRDINAGDQVVHPDIIKFDNFKICSRSYKYVMAMTPFPFYNEIYENPYVVLANSEDTFTEDCIPNPVEPYPGEDYHNSDPDMVHVKGCFYLFWRLRQISTNKAWIFVKKSKDLINWSDKQMIYIPQAPLSPAIIYDIHENKWKMWGVEEESWQVAYFESGNGIHWEFAGYTDIPNYINWLGSKRNCWHLDVNKTKIGNQYFALIVYASGSGGASPTSLFFGESDDGIRWRVYNKPVLSPFAHFDHVHKIYRSTFIIEGSRIKVWYSFSSKGIFLRKLNIRLFGRKIGVGKWGIGYAECDISDFISNKDQTLNVIN